MRALTQLGGNIDIEHDENWCLTNNNEISEISDISEGYVNFNFQFWGFRF